MKFLDIYGPTSVGKTTVMKEFIKLTKNCLSESELFIQEREYTTRPIRIGESYSDYYFVDDEYLINNKNNILTRQDFRVKSGNVWSYGLLKTALHGYNKVIVSNHRSFYQLRDAIAKEKYNIQFYSIYLDLPDIDIISRIETLTDRDVDETKDRFMRDYIANNNLKYDVGNVINCKNKTAKEIAEEILKIVR